VIETVRDALGDAAIIGAGTVLDTETARTAILAGAQFIVTPTLSTDVIELSNRYAVPTVIGAFTPTEMLTAWQAGATYVKVFPASVGGPSYLKDVRGPLPQLKLIPTGGVSLENAGDFIRAGASAIAVGSNLVDAKTVGSENWTVIQERARQLVEAVRTARGR
jgi:2-dehydro-3-deoxyphosphogluconate aldolase/(4S)-4-hydroxy-2-oxoglutarate aldolase